MAKGTGTGAFVGFAFDSAWGTFVAGKLYTRQLVKEDLHLNKPYTYDSYISGTAYQYQPVEGVNNVTGGMTFKNCYTGIEYPLYYLLNGTASGATPTLSETNHVGTWVYTIGTALPTVGLSVSVNRSLMLFQYAGCYVTKGVFSFKQGLPGETEFSVVGKSEATAAVETASGKTFNTYVPLLATQGSVTIGAATICPYLKEATIVVEHEISEDAGSLCSNALIQPVRTGPVKVSGTVTGYYDDTATHGTKVGLYDKFAAGTEVDMSFIWTGGVAYGGTNYSQTIALKSCVLGPTGTPVTAGPGLYEITAPFTAYYDGTNEPITITLVNTDITTLS